MPDRKTRKQQLTELRTGQILRAAIEVFSQKGYEGATTPEIARLAGVAPGTIYLYFENKRDLFVASLRSMLLTPLLADILGVGTAYLGQPILGALRERVGLLRSEALPRLACLMGEIQRDEELRTMAKERVISPLLSRMEQVLDAGIANGELRKFDYHIVVRLIGAMMLGMIPLTALEGEDSPLTTLPKEEVARAILDFVLHGLAGALQKEAE